MASVSMMVVDDCIDGCKDCHSGICYSFQSWRILLLAVNTFVWMAVGFVWIFSSKGFSVDKGFIGCWGFRVLYGHMMIFCPHLCDSLMALPCLDHIELKYMYFSTSLCVSIFISLYRLSV